MKNKRKINALSVAMFALIFALLACYILFTLYQDFGLLGGDVEKITDYTIKFIVKNDKNIEIITEKDLYLFDSREFFGIVRGITYNDNNEMIVTIESKGFYKDNIFLLNGKRKLDIGSELAIMNNNCLIQITNIY